MSSPGERMSAVDRAWLRMDRPNNLMVITGIIPFAEPMSLAALKEVIAERLLVTPRFRQRVVRQGGKSYWQDDPHFDLDYHVQSVDLPDPADEAALQAFAGQSMSVALDLDRPLWQFQLIESYRGRSRSAVVTRLHHCIGDGVALMMVLLSLTDLSPDAASTENPLTTLFRRDRHLDDETIEHARQIMPEALGLMMRSSAPGPHNSRFAKLKTLARIPAALARLTFRPGDSKTVFKDELVTDKLAAWSESIPLDRIKELKARTGGTINDVLLTAMAGALRRYLGDRAHDLTADVTFRAAIPVSLRPIRELADLGNRFGLFFLTLPVGTRGSSQRLVALRRHMHELKGSIEAGVVYGLLAVMGFSPLVIQNLIIRIFQSKASAVMTNVPGPRQTLYIAGRPISDLLFWVPATGNIGLGISICSYAGSIRVGIKTDRGMVDNPQQIVEAFHHELERMSNESSR